VGTAQPEADPFRVVALAVMARPAAATIATTAITSFHLSITAADPVTVSLICAVRPVTKPQVPRHSPWLKATPRAATAEAVPAAILAR
jgi:hypothetical protein